MKTPEKSKIIGKSGIKYKVLRHFFYDYYKKEVEEAPHDEEGWNVLKWDLELNHYKIDKFQCGEAITFDELNSIQIFLRQTRFFDPYDINSSTALGKKGLN